MTRPELNILPILLNYEYYLKYRQYIKIKKEERELTVLYELLDKVMTTYQKDARNGARASRDD